MLKRIKDFFKGLKQDILYILGPKKSIPQILSELAQEAEQSKYNTKLRQGAKLPVESLKLVWDKEKDKK